MNDQLTIKDALEEFVAGDQVEYEDEQGNPIDEMEPGYQPFHMEQ